MSEYDPETGAYRMDFTVTLDLGEMRCRRCRRPFAADDGAILHSQKPKGRQPHFVTDGMPIATVSAYHQRCLPPQLFHRMAGSRPVGQWPQTDVPQQ